LEETFRLESEDAFTIKQVKKALSEETDPFCYFIHMQGVHYEYQPHICSYRQFGNLSTYSLYRNLQIQRKLYDSRLNRFLGLYPVSETDIAHFKNLYRACIYEADQLIGELIEWLHALDLFDETIIIVFGDHGDAFDEDGIFGHNFTVSDSVVRVPLLIRDPEQPIHTGVHEEIVQLNDLYPTILDAVGCDSPETRSRSLYANRSRDCAFVSYSTPSSMWKDIRESLPAEFDKSLDECLEREQRLVWQLDEKKLVWYPLTDRYEPTGGETDKLWNKLSAHMSSLNPVQPAGEGNVSEAVLDNIRDMGYL